MPTRILAAGEPAPWFHCRSQANPDFAFDTVAGRYVMLCFFGSAAQPLAAEVLEHIQRQRQCFDDSNASFFGVTVDPEDERQQRVADTLPGLRFFWDFDRKVSRLYGAQGADGHYHPATFLLDARLRILAILPITQAAEHVAQVIGLIQRLPAIAPPCPAVMQAPVLVVPRIFEPELCQRLIALYEERGGFDSGFMQDQDGKTVTVHKHSHKRRRDHIIEDEEMREACLDRIRRRLLPEIHKAFQFSASHIERYLVACYDGEEGGHFRPHRDNTTKGTAHRRFAVSLFLNSGAYEGGHLRFPEFGNSLYSAPSGGAVVFSCSLLHEATPVTRGKRYMFLPFLYDQSGRQIREANLKYLEDSDEQQA
ncbi:2OG-Fe(II) oxygenase [Zestomonas carbonaria]|uniref:PKHD-type hydroxylase YbiX n=1 Tax=Zestomonas carbonaria TaxID=2762745 RepID=A0A7U7IA78_9GAMM|nr:2OG-Fe(II) oxygenase [Pseudomonas carbonaria]CAD5108956.1 PKHD-type hydroxylase YbiX [Pseudomonas carbonaria]